MGSHHLTIIILMNMAFIALGGAIGGAVALQVGKYYWNKKSAPEFPNVLSLVDKVDEGKSVVSAIVYADKSFLNNMQKIRDELNAIPDDGPLKIIMTTNGGALFHCSRLLRLLRSRKHPYVVYVRKYCMSAGTLLALGAKEIVMLENDSFLGKVDPISGKIPIVHVLKAFEQIHQSEKSGTGKRKREPEITLADRIKLVNARDGMNEMNLFLAQVGLNSDLEQQIRDHFIMSDLPHEHKFDYAICQSMGLPVRLPTEDELQYFD